ncbi:MAG TPA: RNHCP domain-containing protein [Anaerolineales bacterium]|nr:RNHCP domain-containing protein [Anaerolineales bacterium]
MKRAASSFGDFRCAHCRNIVSAQHLLSGVNNRNHCPYCLWSCHLDLYSAGDRLSACKGQMKPIGLTMKNGRNRYRLESGGELMLIHECIECGSLSINRIAADDDPESILEVFNTSLQIRYQIQARSEADGIIMLGAEDGGLVRSQLFGQNAEMPIFA